MDQVFVHRSIKCPKLLFVISDHLYVTVLINALTVSGARVTTTVTKVAQQSAIEVQSITYLGADSRCLQ